MHVTRRAVVIAAAGVFAVAAAATVGVAIAGGGDDEPLTGQVRASAVAAALEHTGGGEVVETEVGDGGAAYEVEVRLPDGSVVGVELDEGFTVIGTESEAADDSGGADDAEDDDSDD